MFRSFALFVTIAAAAGCAQTGKFDGHWLLKPETDARNRAWSLEISGSTNTAKPAGWFVSAFNGDRNAITDAKIDANGDLVFWWDRKPRDDDRLIHLEYRCTLDGADRMHGVFTATGRDPVKFAGWRAPVIADRDDGSWKEGKPVVLFGGSPELKGWKNVEGWEVRDGVLRNKPPVRDIISDQRFWNFTLHMEYRLQEHSNSGIGLRARYEIQLLDDYGKQQDTHSHGALYSRITPRVNASKPVGEWQTMDIRLVGRDVTVVLNGQTVIDKGRVEGLTAMATDPYEDRPGPIQVQGDHTQVEIRKLVVTPLEKK